MMQVKFSGRHLRGARVGSTRNPAPARTAGLDFNLPVYALRAEPRLGIGTIRAPGENVVAVRKDRGQPMMTKAVWDGRTRQGAIAGRMAFKKILKGFQHSARRCEARATPGMARMKSKPQRGFINGSRRRYNPFRVEKSVPTLTQRSRSSPVRLGSSTLG
jgi:hypothetical protein